MKNARTVAACVSFIAIGSATTNAKADEPSSAASAPTEPVTAKVPERPERLNAVQLDLGLAVVGIAYERVFARRFAAQIEGHVFGTWFGPIVDLPNLSGLGGQVRPSIFLTDDGPRGVYVAPYFRLNRVRGEADSGAKGDAVGWSTGAFCGYSFVFRDRVNLRIGAGLQYMHYVVEARDPTNPNIRERLAFKTLFPALDLVVGVVF